MLARTRKDGDRWIAVAYQAERVFCEVGESSERAAFEALTTEVQNAVAVHGKAWIEECKQAGPGAVNCPEGAIKLPIDLWICKLTRDTCPIQAQVFLNDRDFFLRHCHAPRNRKEQILSSIAGGAYDGFHHVPGRYLCPACEHEGKKPTFQYHYPWEITRLDAYYPFEYERHWPAVRKKLKDKTFGLTLVSTALCAPHCKELAERLDSVLAAQLFVIEFEFRR